MGYKKSSARLEFDAFKARTLKVVSKAEKTYAVRADLSDYTLCSALFLTHAHFENYVADVCEGFVHTLNGKALACSDLPGRMRECGFVASLPHDALKRFYMHHDERQLLDVLHDGFKQNGFPWARDDFRGPIETKIVIGDNGYPSSKNFRQMFYKFGVGNIYAKLNASLHTDVESLLDGIGGLRCEMAHVGMPPLVTAGDIADKIRKLGSVVAYVDRLIQRLTSSL